MLIKFIISLIVLCNIIAPLTAAQPSYKPRCARQINFNISLSQSTILRIMSGSRANESSDALQAPISSRRLMPQVDAIKAKAQSEPTKQPAKNVAKKSMSYDRDTQTRSFKNSYHIEEDEAEMLCDALEIIKLNKLPIPTAQQTIVYNSAQLLIKQLDDLGREAENANHKKLATFCQAKSSALQKVRQAPFTEPIESAPMACE